MFEGTYYYFNSPVYVNRSNCMHSCVGVNLGEVDENTLFEIRNEAQMMDKLGNHPNVVR